jgi:hypothetical protein
MAEVATALFLLILLLALALHIFSVPANWIILVLIALWKWTHADLAMSWQFFGFLFLLAAVGEGLEFVFQAAGAKRYGSSGRGNLGGIIGAIIGAIVGAPFLFGLGALVGALLGAWAGCLALELGQGRSMPDARRAAWGAMWGKFFGLVAKFGMGVAMLALTIPRIWPA